MPNVNYRCESHWYASERIDLGIQLLSGLLITAAQATNTSHYV